MSYYEILEIPVNVEHERIKEVMETAYKKYATCRHKATAEARWILVSVAWDCLKDPVKCKAYDKKLIKAREEKEGNND